MAVVAVRGVHKAISYAFCPSLVKFLPTTIGEFLRTSAEKHGQKPACISAYQDTVKTFEEIHRESRLLAAGFLATGLKPGDRIGIWGPNSYEWYLTMMAASAAGLVLVNVNPAYQASELEFCINKVGVKALVSAEQYKSQDYYSMVARIAPELEECLPGEIKAEKIPSLKSLMMISDKELPGTFRLKHLMDVGEEPKYQTHLDECADRVQFNDPCNIQFTSGTTGKPKAATLSHFNIVNNAYFVGRRIGYDQRPPVICLPVPLYHCFGCVMGALAGLIHGGTVVLPSPGFDPQAALQAVHSHRCNSIYGTPTMFVDMLHVNDFDSYDLKCLETGAMAGSPCPEPLVRQVIEEMHMKRFSIFFGMTETSPCSFQTFPEDSVEVRSTTVGKPTDHVECLVVDDNEEVVNQGDTGEIWIRGYCNFLGYWGDEEKTKEILTPAGWLKTGDLGILDDKGYLRVVGRKKDLIIRGGENIYPKEIEEFLHTHPDIAEVQVVGVPDPRMGEELCAWVRLKDKRTVLPEEIHAYCRGKISHFKIPKYILIKDKFPMTVTGKVQKYAIKSMTISELGLQQ
ncbi:unnamed protein product [Darwinula stevensoni]|uniref:Medium-chain acyl-CoA ligase ACSF2, mitochondrial n=1 Tax=Darwinula stevensoni TaxID=69355 RepID=A0A7R9A4P7_9CRUS|nr:unnamed protein product [Darwinula stevensoni]CAG0883827.1 unnamed protein product [Darwinula stevensoni]